MASDSSVINDTPRGAIVALIVFLVLLLMLNMSAEKRFIPGSAACVTFGAVVGALLGPTGLAEAWGVYSSLDKFDRDVFYYLLLPPIIFEAGFSLSKKPFFDNLGMILLLAVLGTLLTTLCIGLPLYAIGSMGIFRDESSGADALDFRTPLDAFTFAGGISATDPVATLSIMGAMGVEERLYAIVFGESVLNDAVAIVLVGILESLGDEGFTHPAHFLVGIGWFILISLGSLLTAVVIGMGSALLLKWLHEDLAHHASFEVGLIILFGYASYAVASSIACSGLLSLFVAGVLESHYHVYSLSEQGRVATAIALKALSHLFETAMFAYVGVEIFTGRVHSRSGSAPLPALPFDSSWCTNATLAAAECVPGIVGGGRAAGFVTVCVCLVMLSRLFVVPLLCLVANCSWLRRKPLSLPSCVAIVTAGLRGAIAFALAKSSRSTHRVNITAATIGTVIFTIFVLGGGTRPLLRHLGLVQTDANAREHVKARDDKTHENHVRDAERQDALLAGESSRAGGSRKATLRRWLRRTLRQLRTLDAEILRPVFIASEACNPSPSAADKAPRSGGSGDHGAPRTFTPPEDGPGLTRLGGATTNPSAASTGYAESIVLRASV